MDAAPHICSPDHIRRLARQNGCDVTYLAACYRRSARDPDFNGLDFRVLRALEQLPGRATPILNPANWLLPRLVDVMQGTLRKPRVRLASQFDSSGALLVTWQPVWDDESDGLGPACDFLQQGVPSSCAQSPHCLARVEGAERSQFGYSNPGASGLKYWELPKTWAGRELLVALLTRVLDYVEAGAEVTVESWLVVRDAKEPLVQSDAELRRAWETERPGVPTADTAAI